MADRSERGLVPYSALALLRALLALLFFCLFLSALIFRFCQKDTHQAQIQERIIIRMVKKTTGQAIVQLFFSR
ncbi:hypothetical protein LY76DRAFT_414100 [Colletotrichum caudatum]|nr:hypothetical protein LY76DRAFT_414100 [Colletotrichum caudatum]